MKKDYAVEAVKDFFGGIFGIIMTLGGIAAFIEAVSKHDTFPAIGFAFMAIIFGFGVFGCACSFIDNITSAIAEKSKRG